MKWEASTSNTKSSVIRISWGLFLQDEAIAKAAKSKAKSL
ncbi:hypothetical protein ADICYQ_5859 [Cyclobacterium qasimii M12-11B]|nr:hypothetical protein ADICYQ_5859 [Cyclobacterium qasimii M12-11B]